MIRRVTLGTVVMVALFAVGPARSETLPPEPLVPNNSLITATPEEGRALAITLARHSVHAMQKEIDVLKSGRPKYATDPFGLIAAAQVVAVEFGTVAAANNYWKK